MWSKYKNNYNFVAAKDEYINKFLNGVIGRLTWGKAVSTSEIVMKHTPDNIGDVNEVTPKLEPLDITTEEAIQLEYLPKRDDFQSVSLWFIFPILQNIIQVFNKK